MVVGVALDSLGEVVDSFLVAMGFKCLVALILELDGFLATHKIYDSRTIGGI